MSAETNKATSRRFLEEAFSQGKLNLLDEIVAPNHVDRGPGSLPGMPGGPEGAKILVNVYRSAIPDINFRIDEQIAEGDMVMTRWTATGTHKGELMGIAPTGRQATVTGVGIDRYANGMIVESWGIYDQFGMLQQFGVLPK